MSSEKQPPKALDANAVAADRPVTGEPVTGSCGGAKRRSSSASAKLLTTAIYRRPPRAVEAGRRLRITGVAHRRLENTKSHRQIGLHSELVRRVLDGRERDSVEQHDAEARALVVRAERVALTGTSRRGARRRRRPSRRSGRGHCASRFSRSLAPPEIPSGTVTGQRRRRRSGVCRGSCRIGAVRCEPRGADRSAFNKRFPIDGSFASLDSAWRCGLCGLAGHLN